jgi:uncharacterized membrane protein YbaN (DUF454 family)
MLVGLLATVLAIAGAILPGLPTTPFVLVAVWAFARSSPRLYNWLHRIPLLRSALAEAQRFEDRRAIRLPIKMVAVGFAWISAGLTWLATGGARPVLAGFVTVAAIGATAFMYWIPTDRGG